MARPKKGKKPIQIFIDPEKRQALQNLAQASEISMAALLESLIDKALMEAQTPTVIEIPGYYLIPKAEPFAMVGD